MAWIIQQLASTLILGPAVAAVAVVMVTKAEEFPIGLPGLQGNAVESGIK